MSMRGISNGSEQCCPVKGGNCISEVSFNGSFTIGSIISVYVIFIQRSLYNPTLCDSKNCVRLQRLSDYRVNLSIRTYFKMVTAPHNVVGLQRMTDCSVGLQMFHGTQCC